MSNNPVAQKMKLVLADSFALYIKTQNYHWNVEGPHFGVLHKMFEAQYQALAAANDEIAEHIRSLGEKVPAGFDVFKSQASIKDGDEKLAAEQMLRDLAQDQDRIVKTIQSAFEAAEKSEDQVVMDFLTARMAEHRKNKWMLESSAPK